jgi:RNA polymerase I-specific transcription initiation factor RRN11
MSSEHTFLFASLGDKKPTTARKVHIRRLYDLLQLCLQRDDLPRARRAWAILARCKEVDWKTMWTTGVHLLGEDTNTPESNAPRLEFLRAMMLQHPEEVSELGYTLHLNLRCALFSAKSSSRSSFCTS